jgi:hypothetical protein
LFLLFADDCTIYRQIKTIEDQVLLQNDLNKLIKWEGKWKMLTMFSLVYGSQTAELYSTFGLIKVLTAIALVCCGAFLMFFLSMPGFVAK